MRALFSKMWTGLLRPPAQLSLGAVLLIGAGAAWLLWSTFVVSVEASSSNEFCNACHEMDIVFAEYRQSSHFSNPSGVRAQCHDCHVPRSWPGKIRRKAVATFVEVPSKIMGRISTPEKFEARRQEFAEHVWAEMKSNDSRECRECHDRDAMRFDKQRKAARATHQAAFAEGETCIDCHKGIVHNLPASMQEEQAAAEQQASL
jgi:cytochrome c-type protein NapC